ncbi:unnamed protein product [Acanthoscelides obtectus]|uniref:Tc1-like transposase DDE domain-containing protein n=1 Tax=Acanthoscelides obtectus TaxID=200917 RepID=A0A9P0MNJ1_ACAOB|nr:unnamed protein product [Acanthoscelides obtectus]CAH2016288.1 unnamed protein product [Acanthoscelides obtectus]CAH2016586.1 unnamed protein product [Acanthoscelides obtectus]CAH2016888.1 unnamed protein product [Acanthoscelides obtectus]CAH2018132.1 unnamed protein product [Acanthoscelides obtectus]
MLYAEWEMPLKFTFQHDNDTKHTAKLVKEWFGANKIQVLKWPLQSPDLNPTENLWEIIEKQIRTKIISNRAQLFKEIDNAWKLMDPAIISNLIGSMPNIHMSKSN